MSVGGLRSEGRRQEGKYQGTSDPWANASLYVKDYVY